MHLTLHTDYGLRVVLYLATRPGRVITTGEIGRAYGISKNHLVRVAHSLRDGGFIDLAPGRAGGLALARPPAEIRIGDVVRALEPEMRIVECFDPASVKCPIAPACALSEALQQALDAFLARLDRATVADMVRRSGPTLPSHFLPIDTLVRGRPARGGRPSPRRAQPG